MELVGKHNIPTSSQYVPVSKRYYQIKPKNYSSLNTDVKNLISKIRCLELEGDKLETIKENLQNNLVDLQKLIKTVEQQGNEEINKIRISNKLKQSYIKSLELGLLGNYKESGHLNEISKFWKEFC